LLRLANPQSFKVPATLVGCGNLFVALRFLLRVQPKYSRGQLKVREEMIHQEKK
jgi:hypothetical protein